MENLQKIIRMLKRASITVELGRETVDGFYIHYNNNQMVEFVERGN